MLLWVRQDKNYMSIFFRFHSVQDEIKSKKQHVIRVKDPVTYYQ